ncbi:MAG: DUF523 domain-containing protein [Oscillospiraceae bacterium]|nr:DUF523 domain-containing protein [Oscillospiraceae bacterium]
MKTLLVSACLLGFACKYSGGSNALPEETLKALRERYRLIPVCPECAGGLPVPRTSAERQGRWVMTRDGRDVTAQFEKGALVALRLARLFGCEEALLKERSPSCGNGEIYDGSFCGRLVPGYGTAAELLRDAGFAVHGENRVEELLE